MPQWLLDLLMGPFFLLGNLIWNFFMMMTVSLLTTDPEAFSGDAWTLVESTLFPLFLSIGIACLNIFALTGFLREIANIKENLTLEALILMLVRLMVANVIIVNLISFVRIFFGMATALTGLVLPGNLLELRTMEASGSNLLFMFLFGVFFLIIAIVAGGMITLAVFSRYLKIFMHVAVGPIAIATLGGDRSLAQAGFSWIKTFLSYNFEIVVIGMALTLGSAVARGVDWGMGTGVFAELATEGLLYPILTLFQMIIIAGAVKGADVFMKRGFALG